MMKSVWFAIACLLPATACLSAARSLTRTPLHTFQREGVLGTSLELKVAAQSAAAASAAESAVLKEISRESHLLSSWDAASEFTRWFQTRGEAVKVSPELFEVLSIFDQWRVRTGGALDASAGAVTRIWDAAAREGRTPSADEIARTVAAVREPHWKLDPAAQTATHLDATPLAMNSFVKSYIMDRAANAALRTSGVTALVLNIGGDLVIRGPWTEPIHVADPVSGADNSEPIARLAVRDRAVATSGSYRRGVDVAGRHYSHIVDPRTGQPADGVVSATVISTRPADAGALATAFCVLSPEESRRLAATVPGAEYLIVTAQGARIASPGWKQFETDGPALTALAKPEPLPFADQTPQRGSASREADRELTVTFELARLGGYTRRPYVAVWIEDQNNSLVRPLALWYQKPRWLPELREWYRVGRTGGQSAAASVTSATRSPGKYTLKWDGKDLSGKPVPPGKYTVVIEAAREHGTHQVMRQEIELNSEPRQIQLPGNAEISSASIDYH